jgi:AraC-like DNA-binding protein
MEKAIFDTIVRSPFFRGYARAFHHATAAPLRFIPADGCARRAGVGSPDNSLCQLLPHLPAARERCQQHRAAALSRAARACAPCRVQCLLGLTAVAIPVVVAGRHVGSFLTGQVWTRKPTRRDFKRVINTLRRFAPDGVGRKLRARLEREYFAVRVVTPRQLRAILKMAELLAQHLAGFAHRRILVSQNGDLPAIQHAKEFIHAHATDSLALHDVAGHVHLSPGHFSRLFKQATSLTLIDYVNRFRVEKAKDMLLKNSVAIKEVALTVGFCCVGSFNRAFHKYTGISPTEFRRAQLTRKD